MAPLSFAPQALRCSWHRTSCKFKCAACWFPVSFCHGSCLRSRSWINSLLFFLDDKLFQAYLLFFFSLLHTWNQSFPKALVLEAKIGARGALVATNRSLFLGLLMGRARKHIYFWDKLTHEFTLRFLKSVLKGLFLNLLNLNNLDLFQLYQQSGFYETKLLSIYSWVSSLLCVIMPMHFFICKI